MVIEMRYRYPLYILFSALLTLSTLSLYISYTHTYGMDRSLVYSFKASIYPSLAVELKPAAVYDYREFKTLRSGDRVFATLVRAYRPTFSISTKCIECNITDLRYSIRLIIKSSAGWSKELLLSNGKIHSSRISEYINASYVNSIIDIIDRELKVRTLYISLTISMDTTVYYKLTNGTIRKAELRSTISLEPKESSYIHSVTLVPATRNEAEYRDDNDDEVLLGFPPNTLRTLSLVTFSTSSIGLIITKAISTRNSKRESLELIDKDRVVEAYMDLNDVKHKIYCKSLNDLDRVSKIMQKPVLLIEYPQKCLTVIDNDTAYIYKLEDLD